MKKKTVEDLPYDGIVGMPPGWVPSSLVEEFEVTRSELLSEFSHKQLLRFFEEFKKEDWPPRYPFFGTGSDNGITMDIKTLLFIKYMVSLGPVAGIKAYLSEPTATHYLANLFSERARQAATGPRADELQKLISTIIEMSPKITAPQVIDLLREKKGQGVIEDIDDDPNEGTIGWVSKNGRGHTTPMSAIKDRVSRAKKKFNSR